MVKNRPAQFKTSHVRRKCCYWQLLIWIERRPLYGHRKCPKEPTGCLLFQVSQCAAVRFPFTHAWPFGKITEHQRNTMFLFWSTNLVSLLAKHNFVATQQSHVLICIHGNQHRYVTWKSGSEEIVNSMHWKMPLWLLHCQEILCVSAFVRNICDFEANWVFSYLSAIWLSHNPHIFMGRSTM